ncbi:hypothetical protein BJX96DRAFT_168559 [Aspergillus floccosus]
MAIKFKSRKRQEWKAMVRRKRHGKHKHVLQKLGYLAEGQGILLCVFRTLTMLLAGEHYWRVPSYLKHLDITSGNHKITKLEEPLIAQQAGPASKAICGRIFASTQADVELVCYAGEQDSENSTFWMLGSTHEKVERCFMDVANILGFYNVTLAEARTRENGFHYVDHTDAWTKESADAPPLTDSLPQSEEGCIILCTGHADLAVRLARSDVTFLPPKTFRGDWAC